MRQPREHKLQKVANTLRDKGGSGYNWNQRAGVISCPIGWVLGLVRERLP